MVGFWEYRKAEQVKIYTLTGKEMYQESFSNTRKLSIDVSRLATGIYQVEVSIDGQNPRLLKLIKNKFIAVYLLVT